MRDKIITILIITILCACSDNKETLYHQNGNIKAIGEMVDGKRENEWVYFFENGDTLEVSNFSNDRRHGKSYGFNNNVVKSLSKYNNGVMEGERIMYYPNNQILAIGGMKDNKQHGKWKVYYDNGQIQNEFSMEDGNQVGAFTTYYRNGQIESKSNDGIANGIAEYYDSLGNLGWKIRFENAQPKDTIEYNFSAPPLPENVN
ncbi:MAG: hypothetical protein ABJF11_10430 [Reichenbachiella sp.]|uniref:toxin-antitoxin system YwqK family antitoxin n=1 Tax=Reichenbachiella sp. TaxID=2184521 RepID=UPI00326478EF